MGVGEPCAVFWRADDAVRHPDGRKTTHVTRRTLSVALIVLGAIAVLAAIASATIWRPTDTATLSLPSRPDTPVVVSDAGVLDAVGPDVRIEAKAGGDNPVVLAVGRTADVDAWVGTAAHTRITGLTSWEQLKVSDVAAEGSTEQPTEGATAEPAQPAALPNPAGSDLWVVQQTGTGSAQLDWADRDGRWSLLAATDGTAPAPEVSMTWDVEVRTPWLVPGLIIGGLLLIAGVALLALQVLTDREARRPATAVAGAGPGAEGETEVLPAVAGAGLTRRELRERERAEARRRGRGRTGEIPVVATTGEIPVVATTGEIAVTGAAAEDAGAARGAGIVPASSRAEELRAGREPDAVDGAGTPAAPGGEPSQAAETHEGDAGAGVGAGVAGGAGVVPASDRAAVHRAGREPDEGSEHAEVREPGEVVRPDAEEAPWTEGEKGGGETAAMPVVGTEETATMPVVGTEETAAMPTVEPVAGPAEESVDVHETDQHETDERVAHDHEAPDHQDEEHEAGGTQDDRQGWRSLWGFGSGRRPSDGGKEQR